MKFYQTLLLLIFTILSGHLFCQDTTHYRQENALMFHNNYSFIRTNKSDNFGTFYQSSGSDDMQRWRGHGVFKESWNKIVLTFDTTQLINKLISSTDTSHKDILYIKWFTHYGEQQEYFSIRFADTLKNNIIFSTDFKGYILKIPKSELTDDSLTLHLFSLKLFEFIVEENTNEITLIANTQFDPKSFDKITEILGKNRKGFTTESMFTNEKQTQFIKVSN